VIVSNGDGCSELKEQQTRLNSICNIPAVVLLCCVVAEMTKKYKQKYTLFPLLFLAITAASRFTNEGGGVSVLTIKSQSKAVPARPQLLLLDLLLNSFPHQSSR
jgi:hypothetical protein